MATLLARGQITIAAIRDGADGKPGKDGVSVSVVSTTVEYQISSSATSAPQSGWSTTVKQATDAQPFLWSRTVVKYSDGKSTTTYGVAYKGKNGSNGKNYWQQDVWVDLSAATYDQNTWYTVVGEQLPQTGFAGIKVVVNLNSGTKPSWSTHSAGFSVDFHIDTQASGWGTTHAETIIYSDTFNFCPVSPVSYKQLGNGSRPILYLRGGGKYRVFSTYNASWKIYKDGYTWQSGQYSQSAKPSSTRPTPEGHTLKGEQGYGIVAAINRNLLYKEAQWNTWAEIGHTESWGESVAERNGCRIGDIFTVSGAATDTDNYHIAYYRSTTDSGHLIGVCIAHSVSPKGDKGEQGDRGPQGATGAAGKDAVSASFSPAALTFSAKTEGNGNATADTTSGNTATITMLEGSSVVTGTYSITTMVGCEADISGNTVKVKSVAYDTIDGRAISRTSASVTVKCVYNGKTCYVDLPISVSVSAVWGGLVTSQNGLESKYNEVSSKYNALPLKTDDALTRYTSTIKQSAREISLKVSQTAVGRKNLLVGSALRRQGEGVILRGGTNISIINQYNGVNSAACVGSSMPGLQWVYEKGVAHNIKVEKGKNYTISVMARATANSSIYIEGYYTSGMNTTDRPTGAGTGGSGALLNPSVSTEWHLYQRTFTVAADSPYESLQIAIMAQPASDATVYLCQPMLVEGDEYVGWSLSEEDAEYIGGNLLDNTDTLQTGGNLEVAQGTLRTDANSYNGFPTRQVNMINASSEFIDLIQWNFEKSDVLKKGQDYMFSFMAKGCKGGHFACFMYGSKAPAAVFVEKENSMSYNQIITIDGHAPISIDEDYAWRKYWVHWRICVDDKPKYVMIRCNKGTDVYVSQPKLEYGATMTEYRATKTDFVEDKSVAGKLLDAGIDIDSKEITLTADKTKLRTQSGQEVAVFDKDGLNADLINAKHVWAKSEDGKSTVGHFGNYEPDYCKVSDNVYAPLFVGSATAARAPFYVTSEGAIKAAAGYIGDLQIVGGYLEEGVRSENYMRLGSAQLFFRNNSEGSFKMSIGNVVSNFVSDNFQTGGLKLEYKRNYEKPVGPGGETATAFQANYGLVLDVSGTMDQHSRESPIMAANPYPNGNHSVFIRSGDIAGFRPMLTVAKVSRKISKMECVIVCHPTQSGSIILTLPDDPEIGQYYKLIMRAGRYTGVSWGKVYLKSNTSGKPITCYGKANTREFLIDWQFQVTELWFDGDYWILQWHAQA